MMRPAEAERPLELISRRPELVVVLGGAPLSAPPGRPAPAGADRRGATPPPTLVAFVAPLAAVRATPALAGTALLGASLLGTALVPLGAALVGAGLVAVRPAVVLAGLV